MATVGEPLSVGAGEENPFNLTLDVADREGPTRVVSASVTSGESKEEVIDPHSTLQLDADGAFAGVLASRMSADSEVVDLLASYQELVPGLPETVLVTAVGMGGGPLMVGMVDEEALWLRIEESTENTFAAPASASAARS